MTIEESLYARVTSGPAVAALIGDRLYPNKIPDNDSPRPWVYYTVPEVEPLEGLTLGSVGSALVARHSVEFDVYAETYAQARAIADAILTRIHGQKFGTVTGCLWMGNNGGEVEDGYTITSRYQVIGPYVLLT